MPEPTHSESLERAVSDVGALIAFGAREFGGDATSQALGLVERSFRQAGAEVLTEPVYVPRFSIFSSSAAVHVGSGTQELSHEPLAFTSGSALDVELIDLERDPDALTSGAASGKAVLVRTPITYSPLQLYEDTVKAGAVALLLDSHFEPSAEALRRRTVWKPDEHADAAGPIPALALSAVDADRVRAMGRGAHVSVSVESRVDRIQTRSAIGRIEGTEHPDQIILVTAHIDSWYVGANDNATSVAALLELARHFAEHRPAHTIELAALAGEEVGLFGASTFVRNRHDTFRSSTVLAVTLEMLAPRAASLRIAALEPRCEGCAVTDALEHSGLGEIFELHMTPDELRRQAGMVPADQGVFWEAGVPGLLLVAAGYPEYHTQLDGLGAVDLALYDEVLGDLVRFIEEVDGRDLKEEPTPEAWIPVRLSAGRNKEGMLSGRVFVDGPVGEAKATVFLLDEQHRMISITPAQPSLQEGELSFSFSVEPPESGWLKAFVLDDGRAGAAWKPVGGSEP